MGMYVQEFEDSIPGVMVLIHDLNLIVRLNYYFNNKHAQSQSQSHLQKLYKVPFA